MPSVYARAEGFRHDRFAGAQERREDLVEIAVALMRGAHDAGEDLLGLGPARRAMAAAHLPPDDPGVMRARGAYGLMVDAEGIGDGADFPVLAEMETANLGVLLGRDHGGTPGTRDGRASAVEGARRFPGHKPSIATRPPGARSAPPPSPCPRAGVAGGRARREV